MPVYCYICPHCGHKAEFLRQMSESGNPQVCRVCSPQAQYGEPAGETLYFMRRDLQAERLGSTDLPYAQPVYSDAMGINPSQIPEFRRAHPGVEVARDGRIVLRSHHERKRVMKELGFLDRKGF